MDLSKKERLQLIYQLKILSKLYPEEGYDSHITALENGYELHYSWIFENLDDGLSKEECRRILDILGMYRAIIFSYQRLENKSDIDEDLIRFPGFDGNEETKYMFYVQYFIDELDRYKEIKEVSSPGYNSHEILMDTYITLLDKYNSFPKELGGLLREKELRELLEKAPKGS